MERSSARLLALACLVILGGCGAATPRLAPLAEGALPVSPGSRLYFESTDARGAQEVTVAVVDGGRSFAYELACGHVEPARALASPTTGSVDPATLAGGRDVYGIDRCDRRTDHPGGALPAFLVSQRALSALDHHERTTLRMQDRGASVGLVPLGHETLSVRVDGRSTPVPTIHARGDGVDVWIAEAGTPVVVREVDHGRGFTLEGIDTADGRAPRARP